MTTTTREDLFRKIDRAIDLAGHGKVEFIVTVTNQAPVRLETVFESEPGIIIRQNEPIKKIMNDVIKDWA